MKQKKNKLEGLKVFKTINKKRQWKKIEKRELIEERYTNGGWGKFLTIIAQKRQIKKTWCISQEIQKRIKRDGVI